MDEMTLGTSKYVSTKRASKITGYAQDYVGQLVRSGKIKATKVGKAWFVLEDDALRLSGKPSALSSPDRALAVLEKRRTTTTQSVVSVSVEYPKTWSSVQYFREDEPLLPISDNRDAFVTGHSIELIDEHRVKISRSAVVEQKVDSHMRIPGGAQTIELRSVDGIRYSRGEALKASDDFGHSSSIDSMHHAPLQVSGRVNSGFDFDWILRVVVSAILVSMIALFVPIFS